jgi:hypothetical protein
MKLKVRQLTRADSDAYNKLAEKSFAKAKNFDFETKAIQWGVADEIFYQFGFFCDGQLISYMRLEWMVKLEDFSGRLKYQPAEDELPSTYLNIAGTDPEYTGRGLNSILRHLAFRVSMNWGVKYIYGSMMPNSPRVNLLSKLGYEFWQSNEKWNSAFRSEDYPLIARLNLREKGWQALKLIKEENPGTFAMTEFNVDMNSIQIRTPMQIHHIISQYHKFVEDQK